MAKKPSLLDDVRAGIVTRRGFRPWFETLSPDMQSEVAGVKAAWYAGELPGTRNALARRLSQVLKGRGIEIGMQGVLRWLEKP